MKRIWIWLALLAAVAAFGMFPAQGTDAADLLPAQLLLVEASGGTLRLETDQGSVGFGKTLGEAMDDLQAGAKGQVFFGTVERAERGLSAAAARGVKRAAPRGEALSRAGAAGGGGRCGISGGASRKSDLAENAGRAALWPAAGGSAAADDGRRASPCRIDQPSGSAMHGCWLQ